MDYQTELCNYIALHDVSLVYIIIVHVTTCQVHEFQSFLHNKYIYMQQLLTFAMLPLLKNTSELINNTGLLHNTVAGLISTIFSQ